MLALGRFVFACKCSNGCRRSLSALPLKYPLYWRVLRDKAPSVLANPLLSLPGAFYCICLVAAGLKGRIKAHYSKEQLLFLSFHDN
jgi:hypothetical protein